MSSSSKSLLFAILTILSWSTVSTAFKLSLAVMTPEVMTAVAMSVATLVLLPPALMEVLRRKADCSARSLLLTAASGCVIAVYYIVLLHGYALMPAQVAQPVNYTWSIMLAILLSVVRRTRLSCRQLFWMAVAWTGAAIIAWGGQDIAPVSIMGLLLVLVSTLLFAVYWVLTDSNGSGGAVSMFLAFFLASLLTAGYCGVTGNGADNSVSDLSAMLPAVYLGFFELSLPYLCWRESLRLTKNVALLGTLPLIVPFLSLFWIHLVLGEPVLPTTIMGLVLIAGGVFMQTRLGH